MKRNGHEGDSLANLEAEDELFGEAIQKPVESDAPLEVMDSHDLSESSAARASRMQIANRNSAHAGIELEDRIASAPQSPKSSSANMYATLAIIVVAVLGALYMFTLGAKEEPAPSVKAPPTAEAPEAAAEPATAKAPVSDEGKGDGTPTLDADTIIKGIVASGWRVGNTSSDKMDEVVQTNLLAEKGGSAASAAIYESGTWEWAEKLESTTEPPAQVVTFGRTIVRISPGPASKSNGAAGLRTSLLELKAQARQKLGQP